MRVSNCKKTHETAAILKREGNQNSHIIHRSGYVPSTGFAKFKKGFGLLRLSVYDKNSCSYADLYLPLEICSVRTS